MRYIYSDSTDPCWNLALEQYVFDRLDPAFAYFMLWQNKNAIIVGKNQNTAAEINAAYVRANGIQVVRRLSGGGAVYHDLGNLNFTFIADSKSSGFDFSTFCGPVIQALGRLGVRAELSGRNDMTIGGKKFSGNSMYKKHGRVMHHGTIMYDSDLQVLANALQVPKDKIESKGIQSVSSRVTNIKPHMPEDLPVQSFITALRDLMFAAYKMEPYTLTEEDRACIQQLRDERYSRWEWNFGASPKYSIQKERRFPGCGKIEVGMEVRQGIITGLQFHGDFFGNGDLGELVEVLQGKRLQETDITAAIQKLDIKEYFHNLHQEDFIGLMLE